MKKRRFRAAAVFKFAAVGVLVMFIAEVLRIFIGSNFFSVVPHRCYRSAQPTPEFLEDAQRTYGIRTIINLRDENEDQAWYRSEKQAAKDLGLELVNAGLSSKEHPPEKEFRILIKALHECPEPMLIHCANGNDRTGLASALYLLLRTPTQLPEARGQLSLRYGHIAWSKASCLRRILDNYESWLEQNHFTHSAEHLCHWADHVFKPEPLPE